MRAYAHIRTRIYAYTRASVLLFASTKNTRKGIHEMTTDDIMILAIMAAWLLFVKWVMR